MEEDGILCKQTMTRRHFEWKWGPKLNLQTQFSAQEAAVKTSEQQMQHQAF